MVYGQSSFCSILSFSNGLSALLRLWSFVINQHYLIFNCKYKSTLVYVGYVPASIPVPVAIFCLWFVVCGLWFVVCGLWFVVCGLWFETPRLASPATPLSEGNLHPKLAVLFNFLQHGFDKYLKFHHLF